MHVLEIPNEYTVLVDYGIEDGAAVGDLLRIYKEGDPVKDLKGDIIGTLDQIKEEVEVTTVYPRFSVCQKRKQITIPSLTPLADFLSSMVPKTEESQVSLYVNKEEISNRAMPSPSSPVSIGDEVMLLHKAK